MNPYSATGGRAVVLRGDARQLPLPDESVDLIVTSPPYYALRSYVDSGEHYDGQIGSEATPGEYIENLLACTREWMRVLKPSGSIFVNLGDSYSRRGVAGGDAGMAREGGQPRVYSNLTRFAPAKSLMLLPERYRIACVDQLGLIARAVILWVKVNGMPESVTDRVRRSHEDWVHLTKEPRYFSAVDEIRERTDPAVDRHVARYTGRDYGKTNGHRRDLGASNFVGNSLGKLPGSVWSVASEPLIVPEHLGVDHFACVDADTEILTRRGWLRHDQVQAGDEAAGYNLDAGTAQWTQVHAVHRYEYDGDLVAVEKRDLSMRLTPNHRVVAQKSRGVHRHRGPVEVVRADELVPYHFIPRSAEWADERPTKSIGVDLAALCGWVAAEGWYAGRCVSLCQSSTANPRHVETIRSLIGRLSTVYEPALLDHIPERISRREWRGRPSDSVTWRLPYGLGAEVQRLMPEKRLTWDFLGLPEDERRALLEAFIAGDGHVRVGDGRRSIYQDKSNTVTVDVLQAIAVTLGYKTTRTDDGNRWVLYLTCGGRSVTLRGTNGVNTPVAREHYRGTVWCPTTGTGTFIARRNGRVFITGNSYPSEFPRRIILGWSPSGICTECGEGRRPVASRQLLKDRGGSQSQPQMGTLITGGEGRQTLGWERQVQIVGYACACTPYIDHPGAGGSNRRADNPYGIPGKEQGVYSNNAGEYVRVGPWREYHFDRWTPAPTRPSVVVDPFGGTGTTALVAAALGRIGLTVDRSGDYCRLAQWRTSDPGQIARVLGVPKPPPQLDGQLDLFAALSTTPSPAGTVPAETEGE